MKKINIFKIFIISITVLIGILIYEKIISYVFNHPNDDTTTIMEQNIAESKGRIITGVNRIKQLVIENNESNISNRVSIRKFKERNRELEEILKRIERINDELGSGAKQSSEDLRGISKRVQAITRRIKNNY